MHFYFIDQTSQNRLNLVGTSISSGWTINFVRTFFGGNLEIVNDVNDVGAQLLKDVGVLGSHLPVLAQLHHVHNDLGEKRMTFSGNQVAHVHTLMRARFPTTSLRILPPVCLSLPVSSMQVLCRVMVKAVRASGERVRALVIQEEGRFSWVAR